MRHFVKNLYRTMAAAFFWVFDFSAILTTLFNSIKSNRILVVRLDHIGDYLLWAPQITSLRELYPRPKFSMILIANTVWASLAEETHQFDEILPINVIQFKRSLSYRFSIIRKIRKLGIESLISPVYSRDFYAVDSIVRSSGAKIKIGFRGDTTNLSSFLKGFTDNWYTRLIEGDFARLSEIDKNAEFIRGLGGKPAFGLATLHTSSRVLDHNYFVLVPGGSWRGRCWPTEKFIELSRRIQQKYNISGLICGTAQESFLADAINAGLEIPLSNLCGQTSLSQLIDIINNARILITNETGTLHIGANLGTPTVCVLGGGHFGRFFPYPADLMPNMVEAIHYPMECYGCNWNCIYKLPKNEAVPCIQMISVDSVWQSVSRHLDRSYLENQIHLSSIDISSQIK